MIVYVYKSVHCCILHFEYILVILKANIERYDRETESMQSYYKFGTR